MAWGCFAAAVMVYFTRCKVLTWQQLPSQEKVALELQEDGLWLFRCVLPPRVPVRRRCAA